MYIHQLKDWPHFSWKADRIAETLAAARFYQGVLKGRMEGLVFPVRQEAVLQTLTQDVLKSSEIEGEHLNVAQVRSSLARRLGIDIGALEPVNRNVEGVVGMMLDATRHYNKISLRIDCSASIRRCFRQDGAESRRSKSDGGATIAPVPCESFPGQWAVSAYTSRRHRRLCLTRK